jgi:hypothetical protein
MHIAHALSALQSSDVSLFRNARERLDPRWVASVVSGPPGVVARRRKMPTETLIWLVAGANLFANISFPDVMRHLGLTAPTRRGNAQTPPSSGSIAEARQRLGWEPVASVFKLTARLWNAELGSEGTRFHGLQVLAGDGVTFNVPDTSSNGAEFGRPASTGAEPAAFPQARAVVLVDVFHHLALDAAVGPYGRAEVPLLEEMMPRVADNTLLLLDRNFRAFATLYRFQTDGSERHWLLRARKDLQFQVRHTNAEGDDLVTIAPGWAVRQRDPAVPKVMSARLLRFWNGREEIRLLTSLVDPVAYPAHELLELYLLRWEIEMAFDDMKTEQRGAAKTLRSKTPDGVRQELYGLFLAHNVVRVEMGRAAALANLPPTRISFHRSLTEICRFLVLFSSSSAPGKALEREAELRSSLTYLTLPERRPRSYPRALKQTVSKYPRKRIGQRAQPP